MTKKYLKQWNKTIFKFLQIFAIIYRQIKFKRTEFYDLVIVRVDAIGDYIMWLDALSAYKKKYGGKRVLLICAGIVKPLAEEDSFFTKIIGYNRKKFERSPFYFYSILKQLKCISSNEVFYPVWERHLAGDIMVGMINSDNKVGFQGVGEHGLAIRIYNKYYTKLVNNPNTSNEIVAIEYFTQQVVSKHYRYGNHPIEIRNNELGLKGKYIVVAISASIEQKVWPLERLAVVIDFISKYYRIILTGAGKGDTERVKKLLSIVKNKGRIADMVNSTSLHQLINLIGNSCFVIGNDSAAIHIAAATHVPSICIFHGAHFGRFLPYPETLPYPEYNPKAVYVPMKCFGCVYNCKFTSGDTLKCLMDVTVEMVLAEVKKVMK